MRAQHEAIWTVMQDGRWYTTDVLQEEMLRRFGIRAKITGISARLRDFEKDDAASTRSRPSSRRVSLAVGAPARGESKRRGVSVATRAGKTDRMEQEKRSFFERVRAGFLARTKADHACGS